MKATSHSSQSEVKSGIMKVRGKADKIPKRDGEKDTGDLTKDAELFNLAISQRS
jgi:hypothetical protein